MAMASCARIVGRNDAPLTAPLCMTKKTPKTTIMFVDDEASVRRAFARQMHRSGYDVDLAEDAEEALELARSRDYPLVVTDLRMPGTDGIGLIEQMQELSPGTTYVVVTGAPEMLPDARVVDAPIAEVIEKPWDRERLVQAISSALTQVRGHRTYASIAATHRDGGGDEFGGSD